jgi:ABC-2 type transport system ATP-binding protein
LLTVIAGILPPDSGTVETRGRLVSLLELGAGFHPDFTGRENVYVNASIHGMTRREVDRRMDEIIAFSELENFIDAPVRTYSTGMYTRLGFAVASSLDPDILLLDEVLAVGDAAFQQKCLGRIAEFQRSDATIVFVSHSAGAIRMVCDRAIWVANGRIQADGHPDEVLQSYERGLTLAAAADESAPIGGVQGLDWRSARLHGVHVLNGDAPTDRFLSGDPFAIEVYYEVVEDVAPAVVLTITTLEGEIIAVLDNRSDLESTGTPPGLRRALFSVDALPLLEGRFAVAARLDPPEGGHSYHRVERCAEFSVFAQGRGYGPVAFPGRWSVDAVAPAQESAGT